MLVRDIEAAVIEFIAEFFFESLALFLVSRHAEYVATEFRHKLNGKLFTYTRTATCDHYVSSENPILL